MRRRRRWSKRAGTACCSTARGCGSVATSWGDAVRYNGLGRYDEALAAAERGAEDPRGLGTPMWLLADLVEAAARAGKPERAAGPLERLAEIAEANGTDWALGFLARSRALLTEGEAAERLYREAVERVGRTRIRVAHGRTLLVYGEWLRRENRRVDAREQLRAAHTMLSEIGMEVFAERARRELLATGETVRKRTVETLDDLTPRSSRSRSGRPRGAPTRRSGRSCSSARAPSSGTCARCSASSASARARSCARRCPRVPRSP